MLRLASVRALVGAAFLTTLSFSGCSCEDTPETVVELAFVSPNPGAALSPEDDLDPATPGVQVAVRLKATGLADPSSASVSLVNASDVDGEALQAEVDASGDVNFPSVTLVDGSNDLTATMSHSGGGDVVTQVAYSVTAPSGVQCSFVAPENGTGVVDGIILGADADEDAREQGVQMRIAIRCTGEGMSDGVLVGLNVAGAASAVDATLSGGQATFPMVTLPEGVVRLVAYALVGGEQVGTTSVEFSVDTGRCDVLVSAPVNGAPILAVDDADLATPAIADVDVQVASTRCGAGAQVDVLVNAELTSGVLNAEGNATVRVALDQSEDAADIKSFLVTITDPSGTFRQGTSLVQTHAVDTIAPGLDAVDLLADERTVLTAADDSDDNPVDDLTYTLRVRVTNGDDVDVVRAEVEGVEGSAVDGTPNELGIFSTDLRLAAGDHTLIVSAADAMGNATRIERQVAVDITVPVVTLVQPAQSGAVLAAADADPDTPGFQLDCSVSVANFSTIANLEPRVFCELQNLDDEGNATGPWVPSALVTPEAGQGDMGLAVVRLTLPDGSWAIRAGAVTRAGLGNYAIPSDPRNLSVDGTPPSITFVSPADGAALTRGDSPIELAITNAEVGQPVTVSAGGVPIQPAPTVDEYGRAIITGVTWAAGDGPVVLTADVSDSAGNPAPQAVANVVIDSIAPGLTILGIDGAPDGSTRDLGADPSLDAEVAPAIDWGGDLANGLQYGLRVVVVNEAVGQLVQLRLNGELLTASTVDVGGNHQADFTNGGAGLTFFERDNAISAVVADRAGNTTVANLSVVVNTGQPYVRLVSPENNSSSNSGVIVVSALSNAEAGASCTLTGQLQGQPDVVANAQADGQGRIDFGIQRFDAAGAWSLTVTCPIGGQPAVTSPVFTFNVDMTAPTLSFVGLPRVGESNVFNASELPDSTEGGRYRRDLTVSAASDGACTVDGINPTARLTVVGGDVDVADVVSDHFTAGDDCSFTFNAVALADQVDDPRSDVTVTVVASDVAGNQAQIDAEIVVDRVGPEVTITRPTSGANLGSEDDENPHSEGLQTRVLATTVGADANSQASLYLGNDLVAQTQVAPSLTFAGVDIVDGVHTIAVVADDDMGNSGRGEVTNVVVDATAPSVNIFNPFEGETFGIANDTNPQLAGFQMVVRAGVQGVAVGTTVQVINEADQVVGIGQVAAQTVEVPNVTFAEGEQTLRVRVNDGINSAEDSVSFIVDLTPPNVGPCTFPGDDDVRLGGLLVFNAGEDNNGGTAGWQGQCTVTITGHHAGTSVVALSNNPVPGTRVGTAVIADGETTIDLSLADGDHTLTLQAGDRAGNTNDPGAGEVIRVDTVAPSAVITNPSDQAVLLAANDADPQSDGMQVDVIVATDAEAGSTVSIQAGGQELGSSAVAGGSATTRVNLPEGAVTLTAVTTDAAGNQATSAAASVTVDSIAPVVAITAPADGARFGDDDDADQQAAGFQTDVIVTATQVENGQSISVHSTVGGERCSGLATGAPLTLRCTLLEGDDQQLTAQVSDLGGNRTVSSPVRLTLSLVAPTLVFTAPQSNPSHLGIADDLEDAPGLQYIFRLDSDADGQSVTLRNGGNSIGVGTVAGGSVAIGPVTLAEGDHNLTATVTLGGNTTEVAQRVSVDLTAPTIALVTPASSPHIYRVEDDQQAGAPLNTTFTFNVTGADGGTVSGSSDQQATLPAVNVNGDGQLSMTGVTMASGVVHQITFTVADLAGNEATASLQATVDVVAPNDMSISASVTNTRTGGVRVSFTEPGDDADQGTVSGYQLRHSGSAITAGNFGLATQFPEAVPPVGAGGAQQVDLTGLPFDDATVSIAARAVDDVGNESDVVGDAIVSVSTSLDSAEHTPQGTSAKFGWDLCAGDFNNDGRSDVVVTDRDYINGGNSVGAVLIYYGAADPNAIAPTVVPGVTTGGRFGNFCASADFNEDGFDDLIVSAFNDNGGRVYVFNGSQQGIGGQADTIVQGTGGYFGYAVSARGSILGDGTPDLATSALLQSGQAGVTYFFDGDDIAAGGTVAQAAAVASFTGAAGARSGIATVSGVDVVGDANGDVVIGAYTLNSSAGGVYVIAGGNLSGALTAASPGVTTLTSPNTGYQMGFRVSVGNLLGDARADVIVSHGTTTNSWRIYEGGDSLSNTPTRILANPGQQERFKYANQYSTCDLNGDGYDEFIAGANTRAYLYFGAQNGADISSASDREYVLASGWGLGICVADLNGDGQNKDLAIVRTVSGGSLQMRY